MGAIDIFDAVISQKLLPELWPGAVLVMDNCDLHKGDEIEALIQSVGARIIYLPPYSPKFSPIENCWSKIKGIPANRRIFPTWRSKLRLRVAVWMF
jgi:transposase